jgi:predicted ATPase
MVTLARPMSTIKVPATVQAVLASRIDRLAPAEKLLLQTLAVLGREFALNLVQRVWQHPHPRVTAPAEQQASAAPLPLSRDPSGQDPSRAGSAGEGQSELEHMLSQLQLGEFIYEQPAVGEAEYSFKHALTQEVAYTSLLSERRRAIHERAARAIEGLYAQQLEEHYSDLAHHYLHGNDAAKALRHAQLAAEQAVNRAAYTEPASMLDAGLKLLDSCRRAPSVCARSWRSAASKAQWPLFCKGPLHRNASAPSGACASSVKRSEKESNCCAGSSRSAAST